MLAISPSVRSTTAPNGVVLLEYSTGKIFALNGLGTRIWKGIQDGLSREQIVGMLIADFPSISPEVISSDVQEFVDHLTAIRVLVR